MSNVQKLSLDCKTVCELFNVACVSKMNYGAEVCGFIPAKELERIHLKFGKRLLGVKTSTCTPAVYGELGRKPLIVTRTFRIIKYWFKILRSENCLIRSIYDCDSKNMISNWIIFVKQTLLSHGFGDVWYFPESVNEKVFYMYFEQRQTDCFFQKLRVDIENAHPLKLFKFLNPTLQQADYLNYIYYEKHRKALTRLRLSSHSLRIESGRYDKKCPTSERKCIFCTSNEIEDEYHFVLICNFYTELREKYIKKYYYVRPSMAKFIELLNSNSESILKKLECFNKRENSTIQQY